MKSILIPICWKSGKKKHNYYAIIIIIIIITSSDDIQPSTLLSNQSPSGLIL